MMGLNLYHRMYDVTEKNDLMKWKQDMNKSIATSKFDFAMKESCGVLVMTREHLYIIA